MSALNNLIEQLAPLSKGDKSIKPTQNKILEYICIHPDSTAYVMCREKSLGNDIDSRTIRRYIGDLSDKKLIERSPKEDFEHRAKPCKLTIVGIYYLAYLVFRIMPDHIMKGLLKNYGNNTLFELFIYPYIKQDTLLQLEDSGLLAQVSLFLYECCKEVEHALHLINNTKTRYLTEEIFTWQRIPDSKYEINSLRKFLERKFNLDWLDNAKDIKKINDNGLLISYKSNSILIELNNNRTKATLKINRRQQNFEFIVKLWTKDFFIITAPVAHIAKYATNSLLVTVKQLVPSFIFNLATSAVSTSSAFQILSKDKKFLQVLEKTKIRFDNQYERFIQ